MIKKNKKKEYIPHTSVRYINIKSDIGNLPVLYKNRENCCGCSACYAICPVKAISMEPDEEGFLYPILDAEKCVQCYQCINVCKFKVDQASKQLLNS